MGKRAVLYARVSSDDTRHEGRNLAPQLEMCREHAQHKGYEIVAELAEDERGAHSGGNAMEELLDNIGSIYWWVSVLVVGVLVNTVSTFIWRFTETRVMKRRIRLRRLTEKQKAERQERVERLRQGGRAMRTMEGVKAAYWMACANSVMLMGCHIGIGGVPLLVLAASDLFPPAFSIAMLCAGVMCVLVWAISGVGGVLPSLQIQARMDDLLEAEQLDEEPDEDSTGEARSGDSSEVSNTCPVPDAGHRG